MLILPTGITAMTLLVSSSRGIRLVEIQERAHRLDRLLRQLGALSADSMTHGGWVVQEVLRRFLNEKWITRIQDVEGDIIRVIPESRITVEYYKNGILHFVVPVSLLASSILANEQQCHGEETLRLFLLQAYLLRYEFQVDPDTTLEELAHSARVEMVAYGALNKDEDGQFHVADVTLLQELSALTQNFLESYLLTLRGAKAMRSRDLEMKELARRIQDYGEARLAILELNWPESLSVVNIQHALRSFREEGVIHICSDGNGLRFDEPVVQSYIEDLTRLGG
jgi:glycerol-3-phosphate O-acyltransferase